MLIEIPIIWIIIINFLLWFIIHISIAYIVTIFPTHYINIKSWIYKQRSWEQNGKIYETIFKIKSWKELLPDGAALFKKGFRKKRIVSLNNDYLNQFIFETCRAELVHWLVILFAPIFFIWNPCWAGIVMIIYAFLANLPCIIAQRYNRIRFLRILNNRI
jgi:glycosyl-4,4'-diaponeurosporenoate acyltransferase